MKKPAIVVFRRDLRTADNAALRAAVADGPTLALYVLDDAADGRPLGGAGRWWLHHAIVRLRGQLAELGVPLILRKGGQNTAVIDVAIATGARSVYWNRRYTPWGVRTDEALRSKLQRTGIVSDSFEGTYLREPQTLLSKQGTWFKVFTPFYKASLVMGEPSAPFPTPRPQAVPRTSAESESLEDWRLLPTAPNWASGLREAWAPEAHNAESRLQDFVNSRIDSYAQDRDRPDLDATSALSPYLAFGELSSRQLWHAARRIQRSGPEEGPGVDSFLRQLVWRDFCANLLYHSPKIVSQPFQERFNRFPWADDPVSLGAWQKGRTGYPWIDAGMRQLWVTGWMHNRVRMGVGSFLTKHLLLPWQHGEAWFWDTLVDADPAQNIANWQWVAGCGADAVPYFRIFNPITQGAKFDRTGRYLHEWQPAASSYEPGSAGVPPIIGHREGRERALAAFRSLSDR
ncbi:MAG: deoxyribodipyrimidine photo-lyase [Bryobacterales bacterium]|nr:deoxyribodipyrimidine photo-lyase [Bryobacterales bacterium]